MDPQSVRTSKKRRARAARTRESENLAVVVILLLRRIERARTVPRRLAMFRYMHNSP